MPRLSIRRILLIAIALAPVCIASDAAAKYHEKVLYSFQGGNDGAEPDAGLIADAAGNFYGTTLWGGNTACNGIGCGTIFKLAPDGTETVLYRFCSEANCTDGATPAASLVMDVKGNLYGTTSAGGSSGRWGTVFEFTAKGTEKVLHSFQGYPDGGYVLSGLIRDRSGNFYGTTVNGGETGAGTIYELTPNGTENILYSFCIQQNCADGADPWGGLTSDGSGNLYGTTTLGGVAESCIQSGSCGVVFELPKGGTYKLLHTFESGSDGANPGQMNLLFDKSGNLFGTTAHGNGSGCGPNGDDEGCGTVFEITPAGNETVVHGFTGSGDGGAPDAGLIMDRKGNLYGTTIYGGKFNCLQDNMDCGTVFKISPDGKETILHSFGASGDGLLPQAPLIRDKAGNLYGTTTAGGQSTCNNGHPGCGVVFEIRSQAEGEPLLH